MDYVLCKICKDWADEFHCEAFAIMPKTAWDSIVKEAKKIGTWDLYFGTNEGWDDISYRDWKNSIEVKKISVEEKNSIISVLGVREVWEGEIYLYGTGASYIFPEDRFEQYREDAIDSGDDL